jgi:hypothetical protein
LIEKAVALIGDPDRCTEGNLSTEGDADRPDAADIGQSRDEGRQAQLTQSPVGGQAKRGAGGRRHRQRADGESEPNAA